jgi:hypothetical protein
MSPDDIDSVVLMLHSFLVKEFNFPLNENNDYAQLSDFMHNALDEFCTKDRSYN